MNALQLLLNSTRFDLVMKYACAAHRDCKSSFYKEMFLAQHAILSPGEEGEAAWPEFLNVCRRVQEEGVPAGVITVGRNGEVVDGAAELACAALFGLEVEVHEVQESVDYHFQWFLDHGLDRLYADYTAIEYVRLQPSAHVVNLHSRVDSVHDGDVEAILRKHGMLYYKSCRAFIGNNSLEYVLHYTAKRTLCEFFYLSSLTFRELFQEIQAHGRTKGQILLCLPPHDGIVVAGMQTIGRTY